MGNLFVICKNWICQRFFKRKLFRRHNLGRNILLLIPGIVFYMLIDIFFGDSETTTSILKRVDIVFIIVIIMMICNSALHAFFDIYNNAGKERNVPLHGVIQALQVLVFFVGGIIIVAVLLNKPLTALLTGLGASAAVLMLVFKDSILGFVAGVQLSQNNMIRIGDWIQLQDGSANGIVEEITLNTVKVRNWDNTLSMIPPYTLVSTPFKNWRGMQESGGRQVDKMIYIDMNSIEICQEDMVEDMVNSFPILKGKIDGKRPMTNTEIYRTYIETYLRQHPNVNASLDMIITEKEATAYGLPIEVYFFINDKEWAKYERKQSDIFAHLMTVVPEFGLRLYQRP